MLGSNSKKRLAKKRFRPELSGSPDFGPRSLKIDRENWFSQNLDCKTNYFFVLA